MASLLPYLWSKPSHAHPDSRERLHMSPPNGRCVGEFGVHVIKPPQISIPLLPSLFLLSIQVNSLETNTLSGTSNFSSSGSFPSANEHNLILK